MGYELHVTRREHWADTETPDISLEEWFIYISGDPELERTDGYDIKIGTEVWHQDLPGFCVWKAHPTEQAPNSRPWFSYWKGSIDTKNPDAPTIRKMIQIASALNAKVQGDDGEFYTEEQVAQMESEKVLRSPARQGIKKPWWKFW